MRPGRAGRGGEGNVNHQLSEALELLLERGRERGWVTFEELAAATPDDLVDSGRIVVLLEELESLGLETIDDAEARARAAVEHAAAPSSEGTDARNGHHANGRNGASRNGHGGRTSVDPDLAALLASDVLDEPELSSGPIERHDGRRDDPLRTYFAQMGSYAMVDRADELRLAKKIELMRLIFRRRLLESDYAAHLALDLLERVHAGQLHYDRTMCLSSSDIARKAAVERRLAAQLPVIRTLLSENGRDWDLIERADVSPQAAEEAQSAMHARRRRLATLIEECPLRRCSVSGGISSTRSASPLDMRPMTFSSCGRS
jgi:RNA polymerase primary sigma factor